MPQLNIYLDKESEKAVRAAARKQSLSLSKWAGRELLRAASKGKQWPEDYSTLLGSIQDETFSIPEDGVDSPDQQAEFDR